MHQLAVSLSKKITLENLLRVFFNRLKRILEIPNLGHISCIKIVKFLLTI